jgi:regulator of protease activity HflC (stomatin/prohibitin superfamily)
MSGLWETLEAILDWISQFWPWEIIEEGEHAVRYKWGHIIGLESPGVRFVWPLIARLVHVETNIRTRETLPQDIATATFTVGVEWEITRADLLFSKIAEDEQEETVLNTVRGALSEVVLLSSTDVSDMSSVEELVRVEAQSRMFGWGVRVRRITIIDYDNTRATLRLVGT